MRALGRLAAWWLFVLVTISVYAVAFQILLPVQELVSTVLGFVFGFGTVIAVTVFDAHRVLLRWTRQVRQQPRETLPGL
jgi:hypothetical protein